VKSKTPVDQRAAARRSALNALRRARRLANRTGVELSDWEGEFLGSVENRVETYGRAFGDPEKGAAGQALSALQTVKLKEIAAKARKAGKAAAEPAIEEIVAEVADDDAAEEDGGDGEGPPPRSPWPRRGFGR
jgi:hypothetical protein